MHHSWFLWLSTLQGYLWQKNPFRMIPVAMVEWVVAVWQIRSNIQQTAIHVSIEEQRLAMVSDLVEGHYRQRLPGQRLNRER